VILAGKGSQVPLRTSDGRLPDSRWGDYSALSIDPVDDCTFWYANEYIPKTGRSWSTWIASFKFPNCP